MSNLHNYCPLIDRLIVFRSDWTLDSTHPKVDVHEGWQYANTFDDPDDQWSADMPPALERVLSRSGVMSPALGSASSFVSHSSPNRQANGRASPAQLSWVRRRRWVRVMRRRLDIPPLPFMEPDGSMYQVTSNGVLVPFIQDDSFDPDGGQELGSMPQSYLSFTQDYVSRARYLAGSPHDNDLSSFEGTVTPADARKSIAKLERAVLELRAGMLGKFSLHDLHRTYLNPDPR